MHPRNKPILLIENDPVDINNIRCALEEMGVKSPFIQSNNSEEALNYLKDKSNAKPWLILYGLNSKNTNALNYLKTIKTDENLKHIPIVIIAESHEDHGILKSFELGAAGYIVKPQDSSKFTSTIGTIMNYWNLSELPPVGVEAS